VNAAGTHLLSLINEILDLSKIEAGKLELNPELVNLSRLIDEVVGTAGQLAEKNKNRFIIEAQENIGALTADSMRLKQILLNLLSNACKFTKEGEICVPFTLAPNGSVLSAPSPYVTDTMVHTPTRFLSSANAVPGMAKTHSEISAAARTTTIMLSSLSPAAVPVRGPAFEHSPRTRAYLAPAVRIPNSAENSLCRGSNDAAGPTSAIGVMSAARLLLHEKRKSILDLAMSQKCQFQT